MKTRTHLLPLLLLAAVLLSGCAVTDIDEGNVVFGGAYVLEEGERMDGDLAIFGAAAELEQDSVVTGSVIIVGGNLNGYGTIQGDLVITGGNAVLSPMATVRGDIVTVGGGFNPNGATIEGDRISGENFTTIPFDLNWVDSINIPDALPDGLRIAPRTRVTNYFFNSFILTVLAVLVVVIAPNATDRISDAVVRQTLQSVGLGLLTTIVFPVLLVIMVITVCLIPFALLAILLLVVAWVVGLIGIGLEIGQRIFRALDQDVHEVLSAALGTLVLALVVNGVGLIPCIGWLAQWLVGTLGLGAVVITRFGTQSVGLPAPVPAIEEIPPTDGGEGAGA